MQGDDSLKFTNVIYEVAPTIYHFAFVFEYLRHAGGKRFEVGVAWGYLCDDVHFAS